MVNADVLSRLPLQDAPTEVPVPGELVLLMSHLDNTPITAKEIKRGTDHDLVLSKVRRWILQGWPTKMPSENPELLPYFRRQQELDVYSGCILWGSRVVVPAQFRGHVMSLLHESHPGISKLKSLARSYVWWPNMDADLEGKVKDCHQPPLHPWEWPERPWSRLHLDYAGPFLGKMFLVMVDSHLKWLEVIPVNASTAEATIDKMRFVFSTHGLPKAVVSDNGPQFTSVEFQQFLERNGIQHIKTSPYHPASNGLAEHAVQTFKQAMKKCTSGSLSSYLNHFLFRYRITPHTTTSVPPAELLMGRRPRSRLDLMNPDMNRTIQITQDRQKRNHDRHAKPCQLATGDLVFVRKNSTKSNWIPGVIVEMIGPLTYKIKLEDNRLVQKHLDHIRCRLSSTEPLGSIPSLDNPDQFPIIPQTQDKDLSNEAKPDEAPSIPVVEEPP